MSNDRRGRTPRDRPAWCLDFDSTSGRRSPTFRAAPPRSGIPSAADRGSRWSSNASPEREGAMRHLNELERQGLMSWRIEEHAWVADPDRVVRSVVSMLAEQGKVRIALVELPHVVPTEESLMRPPLIPVSTRLHAGEASAS